MAGYELHPQKDGSWDVQLRGDDDKATKVGKAEGLNEALALAREHRGDQKVFMTTEDGQQVGKPQWLRGGPESIRNFRQDGSLYGEIDHALREGAPVQYVNISPVESSSEAVS